MTTLTRPEPLPATASESQLLAAEHEPTGRAADRRARSRVTAGPVGA